MNQGVDLNAPLYEACSNGDLKIVDYLLKHGAEPSNEKCLAASLELYHQEVFNALIGAGAVIQSVSFQNLNFHFLIVKL